MIPSLHVRYKKTKIKQSFKENRALRTETTINDTYDFAIGRKLQNLPALRAIGFQANRRLPDVQTLSHDCTLGEDRFTAVIRPTVHDGQRASALAFGDPRALALLHALCLFGLLPAGFGNADLRQSIAPLLGFDPADYRPGKMTYDLRRLRLHGLIERTPHSNRYQVTPDGIRTALFFTRADPRFFRTGLSLESPLPPTRASRALSKASQAVDQLIDEVKLAA